jgi:hypothetical protein
MGAAARAAGRSAFSDFGWMRNQLEFDDALFIFNDNEETFLAHLQNPNEKNGLGCLSGGGNAVIRPWQCEDRPRSAGVPTGTLSNGGYEDLSPEVVAIIDQAIAAIREDIARFNFKRVFFSSCEKGTTETCTLDESWKFDLHGPSAGAWIYRETA